MRKKKGPGGELDEETLRRCIRGGDRAAEYAFVKFYERRVFKYLCSRYWSPEESFAVLEELAKVVIARALLNIRRFVPRSEGGRSRLSAWLFAIAKHAAIDERRKRTKKSRIETDPSIDVDEALPSVSPEGEQEERARREARYRALDEAMEKLSPEHREVLVLHVHEGKSYAQIAQICGIPENTVKSRLFRARNELRKQLKGYSYEYEG